MSVQEPDSAGRERPSGSGSGRRGCLIRAAVLLAALFLAGGIGEAALRLLPIRAVYMEQRSVLQQQIAIPDPDTFYRNRPGYRGRFKNREFDTEVVIDAHGLRAGDPPPAPADRTLLVLGDSFAFGWGVEANEAAPGRLAQLMPGWRVLNAGVSGWGTSQQAAYLETRGIRLKPDRLLLMFVPNDPAENRIRYRFDNGRLLWDEPGEGAAARMDRRLRRWSAWWVLLRRLAQRAGLIGADPGGVREDDELWGEELFHLNRIASAARRHRIPLAVAYVPGEGPGDRPVREAGAARLEAWTRDAGVPFLDLTGALEKSVERGEKPYFRLDDHWSPAGHRAAAEAIAAWMRQSM